MAKRIAVIYGGSKTGGGVDTYLTNLFRHVNQNKFELTLISLGEWNLTHRFKDLGFNFVLFSGNWWNLLNIFKIGKYLINNRLGLVVSQGMVANFYARAVSFVSGVPSLVTIHSDWRTDYRGVKKVLYFIMDRLLRFQTHMYIAVSNYLKERLTIEGVATEKVLVIYNGLEKTSTPHHHKTKKQNQLVIGSIGRLHPVKNFDNLIKAVTLLKNEGFDVKLQIAGEGSQRKELEALIEESGSEDSVELLGWVSDIGTIMSNWDLYIQASKNEGFGLSVVQAMLHGLPVVVTPGGALKEIVLDGETGVLSKGFGPEDILKAVKKITKNKVEMLQIAKAGQKFALKKFTIEKWISKTCKAYSSLAPKRL